MQEAARTGLVKIGHFRSIQAKSIQYHRNMNIITTIIYHLITIAYNFYISLQD